MYGGAQYVNYMVVYGIPQLRGTLNQFGISKMNQGIFSNLGRLSLWVQIADLLVVGFRVYEGYRVWWCQMFKMPLFRVYGAELGV